MSMAWLVLGVCLLLAVGSTGAAVYLFVRGKTDVAPIIGVFLVSLSILLVLISASLAGKAPSS